MGFLDDIWQSAMHQLRVSDAIQNLVSGIGTSRQKSTYARYVEGPILSMEELDGLWQDNDLAATIVSEIVEVSLSKGFRLEREGEKDPEADDEVEDKIKKRWAELGLTDALYNGAVWGRLFGEGGLVLAVKGAGPLTTPLDDEKATGIETVYEYDRRELVPIAWYPNGEPEIFRWTPIASSGRPRMPVDVHETRLLRFHGVEASKSGRKKNQGWHYSVLQRVYGALLSHDQMWGSVDAMFSDASQAIFKLRGLIAGLAQSPGEGTANTSTRMQLLDMMRSATRAIMLDAGGPNGEGEESFEVVERGALGALDGTMEKYLIRLAAAARMPLTILLGMSPAGMDATGESDLIIWYNRCDNYRQKVLQQRVLRLVKLVARDVGDTNPDAWEVCWPELQRPKPLDVRTAENMAITSATTLIDKLVLTPEEVALCLDKLVREGVAGIDIDTASRRKRLKDALKELEDGELGAEPDPTGQVVPTKMSERKTPSKAAKRQV